MGFWRLHDDQNNLESVAKARLDGSEDWFSLVTPPANACDVQLTKEPDCVNPKVDTADAVYGAWTKKCPSALSMFDRMMNAAKGKRIVVFLDYDGTLSPIVDDPDRAFMSDAYQLPIMVPFRLMMCNSRGYGHLQMRSTVREVARYFPTAIISGRCRDKVYEFVQLTDLSYAGSHGMDIMTPLKSLKNGISKFHTRAFDKKGNEVVLFQPAREFVPIIEEVFKLLEEKTRRIRGAMVENNKFCVSVHFRRVEKENWSSLVEHVENVLKGYPLLCLRRGRKVLEIRPSLKWDKGHALEYLLESLGFGNSADVLPLYIGDDRTDEDAFKVLRKRAEGYPIVVSSIPKETNASYSLRDPSEVMTFLLRLARWRRKSSSSRSSLL